LDDGRVGCRVARAARPTLEHEPAVRGMCPREFPDEARLAQARLAHYGDGLPMSGRGALERLRELLELAVPPDEAGQAACGARLEAGASRDAADQLVDRYGRLEPLHGHR